MSQISFHEFIQRVQRMGTTTTRRSAITCLTISVGSHSTTSRWAAPDGDALGLSDSDVVGFIRPLLTEIRDRGLDAEGNDAVQASQMESLSALIDRLKEIIVQRGLDFQGRSGVSCRSAMAAIHETLPEFWLRLEEAERQRTPNSLEPAS